MAEQNAHDDERDTADLAADDTADLAIDDATDLAAADTARPQAPAEQPTPAGRAVSPSPSLTPTFAATDRPARRARSGSLDGRRVEDRCRCARCRGCFGPWFEFRHAGRCVADRGICGFFGGFVVHSCSADRRRLGSIGVWFRVGLCGFRRLLAGGLGVCGKRFRVRLRLRFGRLRLRRFGRRIGRCGRLGLGFGKRRRLRFRTCARRPYGRAGGSGVCRAGGSSGARERLCCALEQRRCRVQQRLHEHVAPPSPKRSIRKCSPMARAGWSKRATSSVRISRWTSTSPSFTTRGG